MLGSSVYVAGTTIIWGYISKCNYLFYSAIAETVVKILTTWNNQQETPNRSAFLGGSPETMRWATRI